MVERGAFVKVFPAKTSLATIREFKPAGYFLSNGPGDPAAMDYAVETVKEILKEEKPLVRHLSRSSAAGPGKRNTDL